MEGKTIILSVLMSSLVFAQFQVEAARSCCPNTTARNMFNTCRFSGVSKEICAKISGCILQTAATCKAPNPYAILENSGDIMKSYCKLGCASSVCNAITTLETPGEAANEAFEQCINACSEFCTKGSTDALEIV